MTTLYQLESDRWRLWLQPGLGVQWAAAEVHHDGRWLAVVPDCRAPSFMDGSVGQSSEQASGQTPGQRSEQAFGRSPGQPRAGQDESTPLAAANFHMLPYSNRIRDGRFTFADEIHTLADGDRHAIHGALRKRAWRAVKTDARELTCEYDSEVDGALNWPWPLQARLRHTLDGAILSSEISLTNTGRTPMPAGLGWHPYFVRDIDGSGPRLRLPVSTLYPDHDGDCLPDGAAEPLPASLDFRKARALDANQRIDVCLAGLEGACEIAWPGAGLALTMMASEICDHLVLFNPAMPHFAVEPVSNANDGVNLQAQGIDAGVVVLEPGETLSATMTLSVGRAG